MVHYNSEVRGLLVNKYMNVLCFTLLLCSEAKSVLSW